ncbi:MAG: hypothetical protein KDI63_06710 [Gammaproteobacteria bacterium]|nr:hypothetical protein [Gammaproteobacteria bacterium]
MPCRSRIGKGWLLITLRRNLPLPGAIIFHTALLRVTCHIFSNGVIGDGVFDPLGSSGGHPKQPVCWCLMALDTTRANIQSGEPGQRLNCSGQTVKAPTCRRLDFDTAGGRAGVIHV